MKKVTFKLMLILLLSFSFSPGFSQKDSLESGLIEKVVKTQHQITIDGEKITYTASAGTIILKDKKDKPNSAIFFIAYTKNSDKNRPISFSFNGGPGSSSVWLHLGVLGPKRVVMGNKGELLPPPHQLTENEYSLLKTSDLVFIDPVGTGYSKPANSVPIKKFFGLDPDIESLGEFIRLYISKNNRYNSPKFLIGESYGTIRACGLTTFLQDKYSIYLNGMILVSSAINFQSLDFDPGNDLPYILFLPGYTATAFYHNKLDTTIHKNLNKTLKEVEEFSLNEYSLALLKGSKLSNLQFNQIAEKLSAYTGLDKEYIKRKNLRIKDKDFFEKLLEKEGKVTGRFDVRFTRPELNIDDHLEYYVTYEPSATIIDGPFSSSLYNYLKTELKYPTDARYKIFNIAEIDKWDMGKFEDKYLYLGDNIRKSMIKNPYLKIFVAGGYYDLATPYFAAKYDFDHIFLPNSLKNNVELKFYEAGHMMYIDKTQLKKLGQDLNEFISTTIKNSMILD